MRIEAPSAPNRAAGIAATATALLALVTVSARVAAGPAPRLEGEGRGQPQVMRAVAAAVAAVARDLAGAERLSGSGTLPVQPGWTEPDGVRLAEPPRPERPLGTVVLAERLLDLPPPR